MKKRNRPIFAVLFALAVLATTISAQDKLSPELWKRIESESPKPLPHTPVVKRESSDAQDNGLKTKVKQVITEYRSYRDVYSDRGRVIGQIDDYDLNGNQIRGILFGNGGMLLGIEVYGFLNGGRISLYKSVPSAGRLIGIGSAPPKPNPPTQKPDPRYTHKYEYTYTDGNLTLMRMFRNDGSRGMYYKYSTSPTERSTSAFTEFDELNWRTIYKLDEKGNEIEQINVDVRKFYDGDRVYRIDNKAFDKAGNWTHRAKYEVNVRDGQRAETLISESFRIITYH